MVQIELHQHNVAQLLQSLLTVYVDEQMVKHMQQQTQIIDPIRNAVFEVVQTQHSLHNDKRFDGRVHDKMVDLVHNAEQAELYLPK